ncbi:hypothetical protein QIY50_22720 [Pseudomonas putida]|nr:hypothetical protein QIY50_22720 [Pseudomonas putida]
MANPENLITFLPGLLDSIALNRPVIIEGMEEKQLVAMLPTLIRHKVESIALLSIPATAGMNDFYLETYRAQFSAVESKLAKTLKMHNCMFLQGFPRCLEHATFFTPGMRTDIDIYVPAAAHRSVCAAAKRVDFDYYGFDSERIFIITDQQANALTARHWANKDVALTLLKEVELPASLPIEIQDCYLPYVLRNGKVYLFVSLEIHHLYTDHSDIAVLEANREPWREMGVDRCNAEATLYFNLIRLHRGVLAGEARMRLILDTACLITNKPHPLDMVRFWQLVDTSPCKAAIIAVCNALATLHTLFEALAQAYPEHRDSSLSQQWLRQLRHSLQVGSDDE